MNATRWNWTVPTLLALGCLTLAGCPSGTSQQPPPSVWDFGDPVAKPKPPESPSEPAGSALLNIFRPGAISGGTKEGNYTILLFICRGPGSHIQQAKYFREATEKHAGWEHMYIVHKTSHSLLYWGKYEKIDDARPNLKKAKSYTTAANIRPYTKAIIVPIPGQEDPGPPEWDLANAPLKYRYTVLIAEFHDVPQADYVGRKKFAADYCQRLRKSNVQAYYKHDPVSSIVTVGLFDQSSVAQVQREGKVQYDVRDPKIERIFADFPNLAVNGLEKRIHGVDPKTGTAKYLPAPTYLMPIPRQEATHDNVPKPAAADRSGYDQPGQAPRNRSDPGAPGGAGDGAGGAGGR